MSRQLQPGTPAMHNYRPIEYSHVQVKPGYALLPTADPWSFLKAYLQRNLKNKRGTNKRNFERAVYFADLAEGFYSTARKSSLPISGVLTYYGMLNLVKSYLSHKGIVLEDVQEHHGLSLPIGKTDEIKVSSAKADKSNVNIFSEFANCLGTPVGRGETLDLISICSKIPEMHEMIYSLKHLDSSKKKYLPIKIDFMVNDSKNKIFTEVRFKKEYESIFSTEKFSKGKRKAYFREGNSREGWIVYRSRSSKSFTRNNVHVIYRNILSEYQALGIVSVLHGDSYQYYANMDATKYQHLLYSLMASFYVGSITRYRPIVVNDMLSSTKRPLITEVLALCPNQFLYQIVSRMTKSLCIMPPSLIR